MTFVLAALALFALPLAADEARDSVAYSFVAGGAVRLKLSGGDYTIRGASTDDRIRVRWWTETLEERSKVRVSADVRGAEARIETRGPSSHFRVEIELPARTDLHVRLSAGDLKVLGIEGHKDIESRAGDLDIEVIRAEQYRRVDASVTIGDLDARLFGPSRGWIGRSLNWKGPGSYDLHAHLFAGDLKLK